MSHNHELIEYGLSIEDRFLIKSMCPDCDKYFTPWPNYDWMYCSKCSKGVGRTELTSKRWREMQPVAVQNAIHEYYLSTVGKRVQARKLWDNFLTGDGAESLTTGAGLMGKYIRFITQAVEVESLKSLSYNELRPIQLPAMVLRLDDLPGRFTGFMIIETKKSKYDWQIARINPGAKVAFLGLPESTVVVAEDIASVLQSQTMSFRTYGKYLPIVYSDLSEPVWKPGTLTNSILAVPSLRPDRVSTILPSGCLLRIGDQYPNTVKLNPSSAEVWYQRVLKDALPTEIAIAHAVANMPTQAAVSFLVESKATAQQVDYLLSNCRTERRQEIKSGLLHRPLSYKLFGTKIVLDTGTSWVAPDGSVILSGSFRVTDVNRDSGKVLYHCSFVTSNTEIKFVAGRELERNAFTVIMRECLIQGVAISFNRSYSKHAIEIATMLRPVVKLTEAIANAP